MIGMGLLEAIPEEEVLAWSDPEDGNGDGIVDYPDGTADAPTGVLVQPGPWTVKLDAGDFVGREALAKIKADGPTRKMIGFEMTGKGIARHGYPLLDSDGNAVGTCTSGAPSPTLGKNIGMGYLPVEFSAVGHEFLVDCRGRQISAVVVKTPFYKRPKAG